MVDNQLTSVYTAMLFYVINRLCALEDEVATMCEKFQGQVSNNSKQQK